MICKKNNAEALMHFEADANDKAYHPDAIGTAPPGLGQIKTTFPGCCLQPETRNPNPAFLRFIPATLSFFGIRQRPGSLVATPTQSPLKAHPNAPKLSVRFPSCF